MDGGEEQQSAESSNPGIALTALCKAFTNHLLPRTFCVSVNVSLQIFQNCTDRKKARQFVEMNLTF